MLDGRARAMGLGPLSLVSLADAREKAQELRKQAHVHRVDPIDARKASRGQTVSMPFKECATAYIKAHKAGWRNTKHAAQWASTLESYAYPVLGDLPVHQIDTGTLMRVLDPIWQTRTETASRLRGRLESVLSWATVRGYRSGENPARWRGHLDKLLPKRSKVQKVERHAAPPYAELPGFYSGLRKQVGMGGLALRFAILTAARTGEVIGARWSEIDMDSAVWTVPEGRIKAQREHRVPLSQEAIRVLKAAKRLQSDDDVEVVFEGLRGKAMSNAGMSAVLKRMKRTDVTVHGFRSTFRDWCAEQTAFPREIAEAALAHVLSNKAEAAYQRGDLLERRRTLMDAWARFAATAPRAKQASNVTPIRQARSRRQAKTAR
jgi:integrase